MNQGVIRELERWNKVPLAKRRQYAEITSEVVLRMILAGRENSAKIEARASRKMGLFCDRPGSPASLAQNVRCMRPSKLL